MGAVSMAQVEAHKDGDGQFKQPHVHHSVVHSVDIKMSHWHQSENKVNLNYLTFFKITRRKLRTWESHMRPSTRTTFIWITKKGYIWEMWWSMFCTVHISQFVKIETYYCFLRSQRCQFNSGCCIILIVTYELDYSG